MIKWLACAFALIASNAVSDDLRLAVTTSFHNSGLADVLLPAIRDDTGINVQLLVVGTGQALRLGQAGDVDAILVHAPTAEAAFVANGYGTHRREIMYNDFVIVGPENDRAGIGDAETAVQALRRIAQTQQFFVSRGDDSGTHQMEMTLWSGAGLTPSGDWYRAVGAGMGAALNTAAGMSAYILTDRASWLNFANKADLALLFWGDPALFNQYSYIPVHPGRHSHIDAALTAKLETWLTSPRAAQLIENYTIGTDQPFTFNAVVRSKVVDVD